MSLSTFEQTKDVTNVKKITLILQLYFYVLLLLSQSYWSIYSNLYTALSGHRTQMCKINKLKIKRNEEHCTCFVRKRRVLCQLAPFWDFFFNASLVEILRRVHKTPLLHAIVSINDLCNKFRWKFARTDMHDHIRGDAWHTGDKSFNNNIMIYCYFVSCTGHTCCCLLCIFQLSQEN